MRYIEAGLATTGDAFLNADLILTGVVIWVDSVLGNNSNPGTKELPVATLAQAVTNATPSNGDIIVIKAGHSETLTSSVALSKAGLRIFGLGTGSGAPNFTCNAAIDMFEITAADVMLFNLYFPAATTVAPTALIDVAGAGARVKDCTFICGAFTQYAITVAAAGTNFLLKGGSMSVSADGPDAGLLIESASATGLRVEDTIFDGSTFNWDDAAIYSTVGHLRFTYDKVRLSNNATIKHTSTAAKGIASGIIADLSSEVFFA